MIFVLTIFPSSLASIHQCDMIEHNARKRCAYGLGECFLKLPKLDFTFYP